MSKKLLEGRQKLIINEVEGTLEDREDICASYFIEHSLIEDWGKGHFSIHLHLKVSRNFGYLKYGDYCANFYSAAGLESQPSNRHSGNSEGALRKAHANYRRYRRAVLVPFIDEMQLSKELSARLFPAVIRLKALKNCQRAFINSRQMMSGPLPPLRFLRNERKLNVFLFSWLRLFESRFTKSERDVFKYRAQLMRRLANKNAEFRGERFNARDPNNELPISLALDCKSLELAFAVSFADFVSGFEVLLSPMKLLPKKLHLGHEQ